MRTLKQLFVWLLITGMFGTTLAQEALMPASSFSYYLNYTGDLFSHNNCNEQLHWFHLLKPGMQWRAGEQGLLAGVTVDVQLLGVYNHHTPFEESPEQGISNIFADNMFKLFLFGVSKEYYEAGMGLYLGLYDLNSEFDVRSTSSMFLNPSHGIGVDISQSGEYGPSIFPNSALAFRVRKDLTNEIRLLAAVIDATPGTHGHPDQASFTLNRHDGYLLASELQWYSGGIQEDTPGYEKLSGGGWYYTSTSNTIVEGAEEHNFGFYSSYEKHFGENPIIGGSTAWFLRAGLANNKMNIFSLYGGAGLVIYPVSEYGLLECIGYSVACGRVSETYREANSGINTFELIHELSILLKVTDFMHLQPDFQYVVHPLGGMDAMIFTGCRLNLEF